MAKKEVVFTLIYPNNGDCEAAADTITNNYIDDEYERVYNIIEIDEPINNRQDEELRYVIDDALFNNYKDLGLEMIDYVKNDFDNNFINYMIKYLPKYLDNYDISELEKEDNNTLVYEIKEDSDIDEEFSITDTANDILYDVICNFPIDYEGIKIKYLEHSTVEGLLNPRAVSELLGPKFRIEFEISEKN